MRQQLSKDKARLRSLSVFFKKEIDLYAIALTKSRKYQERLLGVHFEKYFNYEYHAQFLNHYMQRCKLKQSLAFLQYRRLVVGQKV